MTMKIIANYSIFLLTILFMFLIGCTPKKEKILEKKNHQDEIKIINTIKTIEYNVVEKFEKISKGKITEDSSNNTYVIIVVR